MKPAGRKILLLLDNATSHKNNVTLSNITVQFLPPGTTSHIQPMDGGIIRCFKAHYRRYLTRNYLECTLFYSFSIGYIVSLIRMIRLSGKHNWEPKCADKRDPTVYIINNNKGHNTDPCGTSLKTDFQFETYSSTTTRCLVLVISSKKHNIIVKHDLAFRNPC